MYQFTEDTVRLLQAPEHTVSELRQLADVLSSAREYGADAEEVKEAVKREAPKFSSLLDLLPKNRSEVLVYITIVLMIIDILLSNAGSNTDIDIDVDTVFNNITVQESSPPVQNTIQTMTSEKIPNHERTRTIPKIGRNDPCPCGSYAKFKRCHGANGQTRYFGP